MKREREREKGPNEMEKGMKITDTWLSDCEPKQSYSFKSLNFTNRKWTTNKRASDSRENTLISIIHDTATESNKRRDFLRLSEGIVACFRHLFVTGILFPLLFYSHFNGLFSSYRSEKTLMRIRFYLPFLCRNSLSFVSMVFWWRCSTPEVFIFAQLSFFSHRFLFSSIWI